jgi:hypothetical protein
MDPAVTLFRAAARYFFIVPLLAGKNPQDFSGAAA